MRSPAERAQDSSAALARMSGKTLCLANAAGCQFPRLQSSRRLLDSVAIRVLVVGLALKSELADVTGNSGEIPGRPRRCN